MTQEVSAQVVLVGFQKCLSSTRVVSTVAPKASTSKKCRLRIKQKDAVLTSGASQQHQWRSPKAVWLSSSTFHAIVRCTFSAHHFLRTIERTLAELEHFLQGGQNHFQAAKHFLTDWQVNNAIGHLKNKCTKGGGATSK